MKFQSGRAVKISAAFLLGNGAGVSRTKMEIKGGIAPGKERGEGHGQGWDRPGAAQESAPEGKRKH